MKLFNEYIKEELSPETYKNAGVKLKDYGHFDRGDKLIKYSEIKDRFYLEKEYSKMEPFEVHIPIKLYGANGVFHEGTYNVYFNGFNVWDDWDEYITEGDTINMNIIPNFLIDLNDNGIFDAELPQEFLLSIIFYREDMNKPTTDSFELSNNYIRFTNRKDAIRFKKLLINDKGLYTEYKSDIDKRSPFSKIKPLRLKKNIK